MQSKFYKVNFLNCLLKWNHFKDQMKCLQRGTGEWIRVLKYDIIGSPINLSCFSRTKTLLKCKIYSNNVKHWHSNFYNGSLIINNQKLLFMMYWAIIFLLEPPHLMYMYLDFRKKSSFIISDLHSYLLETNLILKTC
jgi:hypothetical protein